MSLANRLRYCTAFLIIKLVRVPWHFSEKALRRQFPLKDHYVIMMIFRRIASRFPVTISYPNPVSQEDRQITLALDLCENNQQMYFRLKGTYEQEWLRPIGLAMKEADAFIDIGANIGVFALTIGQAFLDRKVVAVEPVPQNFSKLKENIRLNGLTNVEPVKAAITDDSGPVSFYSNPLNDGGGSIVETTEYRTGDVSVDVPSYQQSHPDFVPVLQVQALRFDDIVTSRSVVKIDVEGAEVSVLNSGRTALESGLVDVMVVEVISDTVGDVLSLMDQVGFDCFAYGRHSPIVEASDFGRRLGNLLCLRRQSAIYEPVASGWQQNAKG